MGSTAGRRHPAMVSRGNDTVREQPAAPSAAAATAARAHPRPSGVRGRRRPRSRRNRPRRGRLPGRCGGCACRRRRASASGPRGGVPVGVVGPDRDQGDARSAGGQEAGSASPLPWCGTFRTSARRSMPSRDEPGLGVGPEVAGEQHPDPVDGHPRDHRQVVGRRRGRGPRAGRAPAPRPPRRPRCADPRARAPPGSRPARRTSRSSAPTRSSAGDSVAVATTPTSRPARAPARPPAWSASRCESRTSGRRSMPSRSRQRSTAADVGSGVDEHPRPLARGQHERIALADVAGDHDGVRPAASRAPSAGRGQPSTTSADEPRPAPAGAAAGTARAPDRRRPAGPASRTAPRRSGRPAGRRVRQRRGSLGHQHQPAHRPAGEPDERVGQRRHERPHDRGEQAQDGGRRDGGSGEQVGRQRDQADRAGQAGDERVRSPGRRRR